jgi:hypothetical protein
VSASPDILKYFHEEPAILEPVTPDADPDARRRGDRSELPENVSVPLEDLLDTRDAYRGYLAGTNRTDEKVGLTTLRTPAAYTEPLTSALGRAWWGRYTPDGHVDALDDEGARRVLRAPHNTAVLVTAAAPVDAERMAAVAGRARRRALPALRALLEEAHVAWFPEPAHDGHDWSFFSASPMRDRLVAAFRERPTDAVRRFVLPYQHARSESKFYFDKWQLTGSPLPDYIEEV